jgi:glyceraldehyde 3-phosphate dehydrogenase
MTDKTEAYLADWNHRLQAAEEMVPLIGSLWRTRGVHTYVYGLPLYLKNPNEIIKAHRRARTLIEEELSTADILPVLRAVAAQDLSPARIDLGRLLARHQEHGDGASLEDFVAAELAPLAKGKQSLREEPKNVVLYGFGRIGRLIARILVARMGGGDKFRLRAVVVRKATGDLAKRASLLRRDSVHGPFTGTIVLDEAENAMVVNGNMVRLLYSDSPDAIDYTEHGIDKAIVVDSTGKWRDRAGLGKHLEAKGVSKVILTAPGKDDIPNIVFGINHEEIADDERLLSAASCTTNAISPVLKAVHDRFGIINGHVESVHSYTNDQNLLDNFHRRARRGRSAPLNLVITETGAASAVGKALPALKGKLSGSAIRVPVANVSLAILNLNLATGTSVKELNGHLRALSIKGPLRYQIDYTASPDIVSSDIVGNHHAGVVDSEATIVRDNRCVLYVWYDNEYGYACQVMRMLERVARVRPLSYP